MRPSATRTTKPVIVPHAPAPAASAVASRLPKERASAKPAIAAPLGFIKKRTINAAPGLGRASSEPEDIGHFKPIATEPVGHSLNHFLQMMDQTKSKVKEKSQTIERPFNSRTSATPVLQHPAPKESESPSKNAAERPIKLLDFFAQKSKPKPKAPGIGSTSSVSSGGDRDSTNLKATPMRFGLERTVTDNTNRSSMPQLPLLVDAQGQRMSAHPDGFTKRPTASEPKPVSMPRSVLKVLFSELLTAAQRDETKLIQFTIKSIENERFSDNLREFIDVLDPKGSALVHYAIRLQNEDLFYFLLAKNANFDLPDDNGLTPLMLLALDPWPDVNQILTNSVRDCNATDRAGNNVFHYAVLKKNIDLLTCLLESHEGLQVRQPNEDGMTPIDMADPSVLIKVEGMFKKYERRSSAGSSKSPEKPDIPSAKMNLPMKPEENSAFIHIKFCSNPGRDADAFTTPSDAKKSHRTPSGKVLIKVETDEDVDMYTNHRDRSTSNSKGNTGRNTLANIDEYGMTKHNQFLKKKNAEDLSSAGSVTKSQQLLTRKPTTGGVKTERQFQTDGTLDAKERPSVKTTSTAALTSRPTMAKPSTKEPPKDLAAFGKQKTLARNVPVDPSRTPLTKPLIVAKPFRAPQIPVQFAPKRLPPPPKPPLPNIDISDFLVHSIIGTGSFGKVYLVQKRDTGAFYAMKTLSKEEILKNNLKRYAVTERNVLRQIDHPFIVKLRFSFQNPDYLFLIMDFMPGGDLGFYLERDGRFSERRAKIYAAEIVLAIAELHRLHIIFRDLKPDNILLDEDGHVLLSDFGLSKENVRTSNSEKSFCGTFAYLAPEMVKKSGHGKAMDWYLVGAFIFEMVTGIPPFYSDDKSELFNNIKCATLEFPDSMSPELQDLLCQLLERDPHRRIDCAAVQRHAWFADMNWDDVLARRLVPPRPHIEKKRLNEIEQPELLFGSSRVNKLPVENWTFIEDPSAKASHFKSGEL